MFVIHNTTHYQTKEKRKINAMPTYNIFFLLKVIAFSQKKNLLCFYCSRSAKKKKFNGFSTKILKLLIGPKFN